MTKRKPGQVALDAIDASMEEAKSLGEEKWRKYRRELRAWRRVIVAAGKATILGDMGGGTILYCDSQKLARAILKARKIEGRK